MAPLEGRSHKKPRELSQLGEVIHLFNIALCVAGKVRIWCSTTARDSPRTDQDAFMVCHTSSCATEQPGSRGAHLAWLTPSTRDVAIVFLPAPIYSRLRQSAVNRG
jgi:hypothetical protein